MHAPTIENLSAYVDGRLDDAERAAVEAHLAECESCRSELESLRQTVALLRRVPEVAAPRSFAIPAAAAPPRRAPLRLVHSRQFYLLGQATGALAALFVCVLAMSLVAGPTAVLLPTDSATTLAAPASPATPVSAQAGPAPAAARAAAPQAVSPASSSAAPQAPPSAQVPAAASGAPPKPAAAGAAAPSAGAGAAADSASRESSVANAAKAVSAPPPTPLPNPPILGYLAGALGFGLLAAGAAWGYVWLRERPSGGR